MGEQLSKVPLEALQQKADQRGARQATSEAVGDGQAQIEAQQPITDRSADGRPEIGIDGSIIGSTGEIRSASGNQEGPDGNQSQEGEIVFGEVRPGEPPGGAEWQQVQEARKAAREEQPVGGEG